MATPGQLEPNTKEYPTLPPGCPEVECGKAKRRRNRRRKGGKENAGEQAVVEDQRDQKEKGEQRGRSMERTKAKWDQKANQSALRARARSLLVCSATKKNAVDSIDLLLGFPVCVLDNDLSTTTILPELISYDQYRAQIRAKQVKGLENFGGAKLGGAGGALYTHWFPVLVNEDHFSRNKANLIGAILSFSRFIKRCGSNSNSSSNSNPNSNSNSNSNSKSISSSNGSELEEGVMLVFPFLMNKVAGSMMEGDSLLDDRVVFVYCHLLHLFLHLLNTGTQSRKEMERQVCQFVSSPQFRREVPNLGEMLVSFPLSKHFRDPYAQSVFLKEFFLRKTAFVELELRKKEEREEEERERKKEQARREREQARRERKDGKMEQGWEGGWEGGGEEERGGEGENERFRAERPQGKREGREP